MVRHEIHYHDPGLGVVHVPPHKGSGPLHMAVVEGDATPDTGMSEPWDHLIGPLLPSTSRCKRRCLAHP